MTGCSGNASVQNTRRIVFTGTVWVFGPVMALSPTSREPTIVIHLRPAIDMAFRSAPELP